VQYSTLIDLQSMTPNASGDTSICNTAYCLKNIGTEYLVYSPTGGTPSATLNLTGVPGSATFTVQCLKVSDGTTSLLANITGGAVRNLACGYGAVETVIWVKLTTTPPQPQPPVITVGAPNGQTLVVGTTSATLNISTDVPAGCKYSLTNDSYLVMTLPMNTVGGTAHSVTVTGLSAGAKTYYFTCALVSDGTVFTPTASVMTFTIDTAPGDSTRPSDVTGHNSPAPATRPPTMWRSPATISTSPPITASLPSGSRSMERRTAARSAGSNPTRSIM
jgi:hypothetical protein